MAKLIVYLLMTQIFTNAVWVSCVNGVNGKLGGLCLFVAIVTGLCMAGFFINWVADNWSD